MARWHYRHTQIGWAVIVVLVILTGVIVIPLVLVELHLAAAITGGITLLCAVAFSTLTVQVDNMRIRFWLGPGLTRRTIDLADVRQFSAVFSPPAFWLLKFPPKVRRCFSVRVINSAIIL